MTQEPNNCCGDEKPRTEITIVKLCDALRMVKQELALGNPREAAGRVNDMLILLGSERPVK